MKNNINILIILVLIANLANGQTMDKTLQKLIDNKLIEQKQSKNFEKFLKIHGVSSITDNAIYLFWLLEEEFMKITGILHSSSDARRYIELKGEKPTASEQIKINEELTQYLSKLKACDLIDEYQFNHFQNRINNNDFINSSLLLLDIAEQIALKKYMKPEKLKVFAELLKSKEIVNSQYDKLLIDIAQEKLQKPIEFLNYCDKAVIINEQDYPDEPEKYLELIYQKTASVISDLGFTNFEFKVVSDSFLFDNDYRFVVSLESNGTKYKQKSYCSTCSQDESQYQRYKVERQAYYKVFNKVLADLQSPYRLHTVQAEEGVSRAVFGIIALTTEQADVLNRESGYIKPSYEDYEGISSKKIEKLIEEYNKIGLLSHLTNKQIGAAKEEMSEEGSIGINDVLLFFPDVVYMFDTELSNFEDPYAELIREYKKISHNDFDATEISDNFDIEKNTKVVVKFKIDNKPYSKTLKIEDDWIDTDFFDFIDNVVKESKLRGQFYTLDTGGQDASIIYLTKEQYDYIRTNKLLVFYDESQIEEK